MRYGILFHSKGEGGGVESFKSFSSLSDPILEVGVIIYVIKDPSIGIQDLPTFNCTQTLHI